MASYLTGFIQPIDAGRSVQLADSVSQLLQLMLRCANSSQ